MSKINFTPFPNLTTDNLYLRQITPDDMKEFHILKSDERLLKFYDAKPRTYEQACEKLQSLNGDISKNLSITWGITLKGVNKVVGSICFWNISEDQSKAEIGYELMADFQGKGIMQEAVKAVIEYGFKDMKLKEIEAVPSPGHIKSINLLEKYNFIRGEVFYEDYIVDGRRPERVMYVLENNEEADL